MIGPSNATYRVRWVAGTDLGARDPFKILARTDPAARADMGRYTLAVIGASRPGGAPGFVILAARGSGLGADGGADGGDDVGASEELLDHHCRGFRTPG